MNEMMLVLTATQLLHYQWCFYYCLHSVKEHMGSHSLLESWGAKARESGRNGWNPCPPGSWLCDLQPSALPSLTLCFLLGQTSDPSHLTKSLPGD